MKHLVLLLRIIVGVLFIFSGLVKANDPLGLSYKMQEFFEVWGWHGLNHLSLPTAILMNGFEIVAGFALLIGWRIKWVLGLLLILIVFFTFLTGYTYATGKPTNCGCFGDCLPISSQTSFLKDVILTLMILFLIWKRHLLPSFFRPAIRTVLLLLATLLAFGLQVYALRYLPPVDCLPFKVGNSIPEKMLPPPNSVPDSFAIRFIYEKDGKQYEFSPAELPADLQSYQYVSRTDKLIRKGNADPAIKGFRLVDNSDTDRTGEILTAPYALVLFIEDLNARPLQEWGGEWKRIVDEARVKRIPWFVVARFPEQVREPMSNLLNEPVNVLAMDVTAMHTAARTNPCLYLLQEGRVEAKQGDRRFSRLLETIRSMEPLPAAPTPVEPSESSVPDSTNQ